MKKTILLLVLIGITKNLNAQENVLIGLNSPAYGVKIKANWPGSNSGWARGFSIVNENNTKNFFSLGALGSVVNGISSFSYGYIGKNYSDTYMVFKSNKNVGIGTNNPTQKLEIKGNVFINEENSGIVLGAGGNKKVGFMKYAGREAGIWRGSGQDFEIGRITSGNAVTSGIGSSPTVDFYINGNGKIGIGTTNPTKELHIIGSVEATSSIYGGALQSVGSNNALWVYDRLQRPTQDSYRITKVNGNTTFTDRTYGGGFEDYNFLKFSHSNKGNSTLYLYAQNLIRLEQDVYVKENLGIGTATPDEKLTVKGKIHTQEVKVDLLGATAPDYVFEKDYDLKSLNEIENYIRKNKHLPEIPSAKTMEKEGVHLKQMNLLLLKKVEELTLYTIQQEKAINNQQKELTKQKVSNKKLLKRLEKLEQAINLRTDN